VRAGKSFNAKSAKKTAKDAKRLPLLHLVSDYALFLFGLRSGRFCVALL